MADDAPGHPGRRSYDREIDPVIEVFLEARLAATRHLLRDEFAAALVGVTNKLDLLTDEVRAARRHDDLADVRESTRDELLARLDKNRRWMVTTAVAITAVIVAAIAVLASSPHF